MAFVIVKSKSGEVYDFPIDIHWDSILPTDKEFLVKDIYTYKYQLGRAIRAVHNIATAYTDDLSRDIFEFCGKDLVKLCKKQ